MKIIIEILTKLLNLCLKKDEVNIVSKDEVELEVEASLTLDDNKLSRHFTLEEVLKSETAIRKGIDNTPREEQLFQIQQLCSIVADEIREHYNKPIRITSGFRCEKLNKAIGGSPKSQHRAENGDAAIDFQFYDPSMNLEAVFQWIVKLSNIPFDQCIAEFLPEGWIHISYRLDGKNRGKITRAVKVNGKRKYTQLGYTSWGYGEKIESTS